MTILELKEIFSNGTSSLYTNSEIAFIFSIFSEQILGLNPIQLKQSLSENIDFEQEEKFKNIISELKTGKPYLQILGETEFYGMKIFVNENVLIPRPETEELLELAIKKIQDSTIENLKILDIGTGSGIIPLVLKKHFPKAEVSSIDFSKEALEVAQKNANFHQLDINFIHADYLSFNLNENYDVIISNPPYIGIDEENEIADSVKEFEPKMALFSPTSDALIFYKKIAEDAALHLNENGWVFLEINQLLGKETLALYSTVLKEAELLKDLSDNDRFVMGKK